MKKAAVCGGSGFLGSWMCQKLRDEGYWVTAFDIKMPEFGFAPANDYFIFDLRNSADYYENFRWADFDEVYQFAALMGGAGFVFTGENDADIMRSSALINLNVLEECRRHKVKKVFYASSACVYPSLATGHTACREDDRLDPDSAYGAEKLFSEQVYQAYARNFGMDIKIARFHNVFGEYGTWRGGREKSPAAFCRKIAEATDYGEIECWGSGLQKRSFIHASEAVEAVYRLMQSDFAGPVNIGSEEMVSIVQLADMIGDIADKSFFIRYVKGPLGVHGRNSDNTLIFDKLGWKPTDTLRKGLEKTYPWIAEQVLTAKKLADSVASK